MYFSFLYPCTISIYIRLKSGLQLHDSSDGTSTPVSPLLTDEYGTVLTGYAPIKDENGNTLGYVFIGEGIFKETEGSKPMNIKWELNEPIPNYLWKESAKMSIG